MFEVESHIPSITTSPSKYRFDQIDQMWKIVSIHKVRVYFSSQSVSNWWTIGFKLLSTDSLSGCSSFLRVKSFLWLSLHFRPSPCFAFAVRDLLTLISPSAFFELSPLSPSRSFSSLWLFFLFDATFALWGTWYRVSRIKCIIETFDKSSHSSSWWVQDRGNRCSLGEIKIRKLILVLLNSCSTAHCKSINQLPRL
jgi:hypothetical protein